jgi:hypothetical protein
LELDQVLTARHEIDQLLLRNLVLTIVRQDAAAAQAASIENNRTANRTDENNLIRDMSKPSSFLVLIKVSLGESAHVIWVSCHLLS